MTLPRHEPKPTAATVVLLVEDNEDTRLVYGTYLRHFGFAVLEARDGEEGVRLAREHVPHVILMDISLPKMDGWTATELIRQHPVTAGIPVIAVTAHALVADRVRAEDSGFTSFLSKPCDPKRLLDEVRRLISP